MEHPRGLRELIVCVYPLEDMPPSMQSRIASAYRIFVAYKSKKTVKTKDGDETTVYEYGPRQIQKRHEEKADRLEKLHHRLDDLMDKVYEDLECTDSKKCQIALAIALINETFERVGNEDSAEEGHYGVTGWRIKHVKSKGSTIEISYVGKSGVSQRKTVRDKTLVDAIKKLMKGKSGDDELLSEIEASDVNDYLKKYDITAKDIRGYHANDQMRRALKRLRKEGPELPFARKEKDEILKKEFKKALEETAKAVGHEPTTLKSQYLVPSLEESYLHDGTIPKNLNED